MLRGLIARRLIGAFALLTLLAVGIALGALGLLQISDDTLSEVAQRAQIAALSARIRSESLTLRQLVTDYLQPTAERAVSRAEIVDQQYTLDQLEHQALALVAPGNIEESLRLSDVRQNLIAFTTQANRVVNTYEQESTRGPQTRLESNLLAQNYQTPLVEALIGFEQLELNQAQAAQAHARQVVTAISAALIAMAVVALGVGAFMIYQVSTRIAAPLDQLRAGVEDIRQGRYDHPVPTDTTDEIGELADAFNTMTGEVRASRQQLEDYARTLEQQVADRTREVERRANQVITGVEISRAITSLLDPDRLVQLVVQLILERYDFYAIGIFLIDPARQFAELRYGQSATGVVFVADSIRLEVGGRSIVGQVMAHGQARIVPDVTQDEFYQIDAALPETRSEMALPLRLGERVTGVLSVQSRRLNAFDASEVSALQGLADQVAIALENARLYSELQVNYRQLQALEQLRDDLTDMIVHDLRTPLTSYITGLPMIGELGDLNAAQRDLLARAERGGETLLGMINNLLDISRMEAGSLRLAYRTVDAEACITEAIEQVVLLAEDKQIKIIKQAASDLPVFRADDDLLRRVLVNLLGNAIKFSPLNSTIAVEVTNAAEAGFIHFAISDAGPGIGREYLKRIFEKFGQVASAQTGRKVSSGLGLTFCKLAVEAHGGRIWVESEEGRGSTFAFVLPWNEATQLAP